MQSSKTQNKVGFLTFEWIHNKSNVGSTRIRCRWPSKYWKDSEMYHVGRRYDAIIYQKVYFWEHAELYDGIKILDICDPDWLSGQPVIKMINRVDAITCSSPEMTSFIQNWTDKPVVHIPDRLDLEFMKQKKTHKGKAKSCVWFGYAHNAHTLKHTFPYLKKLGLKLTVISDQPYTPDPTHEFEVSWKQFNINTFNDEIIKHDIVLFPPSFKFTDRYKSNNKTVHAWGLGMPVANTYEELQVLMKESERKKEAEKRLKEVKEKYDVKLSVKQYKELIDKIKESHYSPEGSDPRC